jgi:hypothetical protein
METLTDNLTYHFSDNKISFLEVIAENINDHWIYTETGPWFLKKPIGGLYESFEQKVFALAENNVLESVNSILCSAAHAVELAVRGIITEQMIRSMKFGVTGSGCDLTSIVQIPKQTVQFKNGLVSATIFIVDCFSHGSFTFIDENNKDM